MPSSFSGNATSVPTPHPTSSRQGTAPFSQSGAGANANSEANPSPDSSFTKVRHSANGQASDAFAMGANGRPTLVSSVAVPSGSNIQTIARHQTGRDSHGGIRPPPSRDDSRNPSRAGSDDRSSTGSFITSIGPTKFDFDSVRAGRGMPQGTSTPEEVQAIVRTAGSTWSRGLGRRNARDHDPRA